MTWFSFLFYPPFKMRSFGREEGEREVFSLGLGGEEGIGEGGGVREGRDERGGTGGK